MFNYHRFNVLQKSCEDFAALRQNGVGGCKALLLKYFTKLPQFTIPEAMQRISFVGAGTVVMTRLAGAKN